MTDPPPAPRGTAVKRKRVSPLLVVGLVLLASGLISLGWLGYAYFGTGIVSERAFTAEKDGLRAKWQERTGSTGPTTGPSSKGSSTKPPNKGSEGTAVHGDAIALLRVPTFGATYEVPILSGTDLGTLSRGVGHYRSSALPGQIGNFALAGHRVTHGEPFARLLDLNRGDRVVVETEHSVFTYVVDEPPRNLTVTASDSWVLEPVPGKPDVKPTQALMTLTTCQDLFRSPDRSVGFAHLASTRNKG